MAANLQQQIRQLEELSRVQRRFVSDVSHELRTPLTTVRMAADVLHEARADFDPAVARSAELLQTQLDRFESLLADLLEISRFDAGAAVLDAEPVDLRDVVHRVIEAAEPLAERRGSHARPSTSRRSRAWPRSTRGGSSGSCATSWSTRSSTARAGDVVVRVAADEDAVAVAVRDYGVGLKPGEAALVFNRFWRADPARARTTGGTGLGLSIALEDAHLHGGWLQAWGEPGAARSSGSPCRGWPADSSTVRRSRSSPRTPGTTAAWRFPGFRTGGWPARSTASRPVGQPRPAECRSPR